MMKKKVWMLILIGTFVCSEGFGLFSLSGCTVQQIDEHSNEVKGTQEFNSQPSEQHTEKVGTPEKTTQEEPSHTDASTQEARSEENVGSEQNIHEPHEQPDTKTQPEKKTFPEKTNPPEKTRPESKPDRSPHPLGCGKKPKKTGAYYVTLRSNGKTRKFYISIPRNYDPMRSYPLIYGLHGRDYDGIRMRRYLDLETQTPKNWALYVYPDGLKRRWGSRTYIGWQNGPEGGTYGGTEDLKFMRDLYQHMKQNYCVDTQRVFATGQSWGGDFSNVVGCYMGDVFRAVAGVAANGAYYLPKANSRHPCKGKVATWSFHGKRDPYFTLKQGHEYRDYWVKRSQCDRSKKPKVLRFSGMRSDDECSEYQGCTHRTLWCAYNAHSGHQVPRSYYSREVMRFFRSF